MIGGRELKILQKLGKNKKLNNNFGLIQFLRLSAIISE